MSGPVGDPADKTLSQRDGLQQGKNNEKVYSYLLRQSIKVLVILKIPTSVASVLRTDMAFGFIFQLCCVV